MTLPMQVGLETLSALGASQWASGAPRMTLALSSNDSIRLEARASSRSDAAYAYGKKTKKSVAVSWRHAFSERFSLRTGMERSRENIDHSMDISDSAQTFAQLTASLPDRWRLVLGGSLYEVINYSREAGDDFHRDRSQQLSLSANRALVNGWRLSGSLSVSQSIPGGASSPYKSHNSNLRLTRDF